MHPSNPSNPKPKFFNTMTTFMSTSQTRSKLEAVQNKKLDPHFSNTPQ